MGSGSSSSGIDDLEHGNWKDDDGSCYCESKYKIVTCFELNECDIMNRNVKRLANVGRAASLGVSEYYGCFSDITHDFIECETQCLMCNSHYFVTFDYCGLGKRYRNGKYQNKYYENPKNKRDNTHIKLDYLEKVFYQTWNDYNGKKYHILKHNCKDFAYQLWTSFEKQSCPIHATTNHTNVNQNVSK